MKLLIVSGSRNPGGQTSSACRELLEGVRGEGSQGEEVLLPGMQVERCRQCNDDGWGTCLTEGRCVIEDDFASLVNKVKDADAAVFATPVYFSDLSESLHAFLARLRRVTRHEAGQSGISGKPAIGICVAGGGGGGAASCAVILERTLQVCGFDVQDVIPVRRQNLDMKRAILSATGKWLGTKA